jgi:peptidoglycan/LPS O-acetylase OafA/YrhL
MGSIKGLHDFQDCWRIICALTVVLSHVIALHLLPGDDIVIGRIAHLCVVVFFVISGFSVASSARRYGDSAQFLAARWSRLLSVAVPMVLVALSIDLLLGARTNPVYPAWQYPKWYAHVLVNWLFLGEFWLATYRPFSIIPYWSLAYEFWYYCLFAVWSMPRGRVRNGCLLAVILIMGPRIWLLLPCWLLGVWFYQHIESRTEQPTHDQRGLSIFVASLLFLGFFAAYLASGFDNLVSKLSVDLCNTLEAQAIVLFKCGYSRWFLADYLVAIAFAAVLLLLNPTKSLPANRLAGGIRWFAPLTFGVYLAHYTLTLATVTLLGTVPPLWLGLLLTVAVVVVATLFGLLFERTRPFFRRRLELLLGWLLSAMKLRSESLSSR